MWYKENNFTVKIGGNFYINVPNIIVYKGESIFKIERAESTDLLGISFNIHDEEGLKIASVKQGRIYEGNSDLFKTEIGQDRYTLTEISNNRIICDIKKRKLADISELDVTVELYTSDGFLIKATSEETNMGGFSMKGCVIRDCANGIII